MDKIKVFDNILNMDELSRYEKVIKNKPNKDKKFKSKAFNVKQLWKDMQAQIKNDINN
jgi:hypothetical protein